jgi:hypothetical protein
MRTGMDAGDSPGRPDVATDRGPGGRRERGNANEV